MAVSVAPGATLSLLLDLFGLGHLDFTLISTDGMEPLRQNPLQGVLFKVDKNKTLSFVQLWMYLMKLNGLNLAKLAKVLVHISLNSFRIQTAHKYCFHHVFLHSQGLLRVSDMAIQPVLFLIQDLLHTTLVASLKRINPNPLDYPLLDIDYITVGIYFYCAVNDLCKLKIVL